MISDDEVREIIKKLEAIKPKKLIDDCHVNKEGIMHALVYLYTSKEPVSAGDISKQLGVSTARVAVILRKMQEKGDITKETDPKDARKVVISITPKGREVIEQRKRMFFNDIRDMTEKIGKERFYEFLDILSEVHEFMEAKRICRGVRINENNI